MTTTVNIMSPSMSKIRSTITVANEVENFISSFFDNINGLKTSPTRAGRILFAMKPMQVTDNKFITEIGLICDSNPRHRIALTTYTSRVKMSVGMINQ